MRLGNSRNSFPKRFARASDHCANSVTSAWFTNDRRRHRSRSRAAPVQIDAATHRCHQPGGQASSIALAANIPRDVCQLWRSGLSYKQPIKPKTAINKELGEMQADSGSCRSIYLSNLMISIGNLRLLKHPYFEDS